MLQMHSPPRTEATPLCSEFGALHSFYGLVALGLLAWRSPGWRQRGDRALPRELADAIASVTEDPSRHPVLPRKEQAAIGWLVRARGS